MAPSPPHVALSSIRDWAPEHRLGDPARESRARWKGYAIVAEDALRVDRKNPQDTAWLSSFLSRCRMFKTRPGLMRALLEHMMADLSSRDVYEMVSKSLQQI